MSRPVTRLGEFTADVNANAFRKIEIHNNSPGRIIPSIPHCFRRVKYFVKYRGEKIPRSIYYNILRSGEFAEKLSDVFYRRKMQREFRKTKPLHVKNLKKIKLIILGI